MRGPRMTAEEIDLVLGDERQKTKRRGILARAYRAMLEAQAMRESGVPYMGDPDHGLRERRALGKA